MHINHETGSQTDTRLRHVISTASLLWHEGPFSFFEFPADNPPTHTEGALAYVRDAEVWSILKPSTPESIHTFAIFSFHFSDLDNSGFVGWLATHLKRELGTGVFVICGQNSHRGGIFDYWGVPFQLRSSVQKAIDTLRSA